MYYVNCLHGRFYYLGTELVLLLMLCCAELETFSTLHDICCVCNDWNFRCLRLYIYNWTSGNGDFKFVMNSGKTEPFNIVLWYTSAMLWSDVYIVCAVGGLYIYWCRRLIMCSWVMPVGEDLRCAYWYSFMGNLYKVPCILTYYFVGCETVISWKGLWFWIMVENSRWSLHETGFLD